MEKVILKDAVINDDFALVQLIFADGRSAFPVSEGWNAVLMYSCEHGYEDVVDVLIKNQKVDLEDGYYDHTPLSIACANGQVGTADLLIQNGVEIHRGNRTGDLTPLMNACINGHVQVIELLVAKGVHLNVRSFETKTALMYSCEEGHCEIVELLVKHGAGLEFEDKNGSTALVFACKSGAEDIVEFLLKHHVHIDSFEWSRALDKSCSKGRAKIVEKLLHYGNLKYEDVRFDDHEIYTMIRSDGDETEIILHFHKVVGANNKTQMYQCALVKACYAGKIDIVRLFIQHGVDVNAQNLSCDTALTASCKNGFVNIVEVLVNHGADINYLIRSGNGTTALRVACETGYANIVEFLLNRGADVNHTNRCGDSALLTSCAFGRGHVVELLLKHGAHINATKDGFTPLMISCDKGFTNVVETLLQHEADIDWYDSSDRNAVHISCEKGHTKIVELFLKHGTDVNARCTKKGETALMLSCLYGQANVVDLLIEHGADISAKNFEGISVFMFACMGGNKDIVDLLIKLVDGEEFDNTLKALLPNNDGVFTDFDVDDVDNFGRTALMNTVGRCYYDIVDLLIKRGADVNACSLKGETVLMFACSCTFVRYWEDGVKTVELLLRQGCDINAQCEEGETALMKACGNDNNAISRLLIKNGANIDAQSKTGLTACMLATRGFCDCKCLKLLMAANADVNLADVNGNTVCSMVINKNRLKCFKILLESGKLSMDDVIKSMHNEITSERQNRPWSPSPSKDLFLMAMRFNIFDWEWCYGRFSKPVLSAAFAYGFCPGKIRTEKEKISPLLFACVNNLDSMAKKFIENFYFYPEDYTALCADETIRCQIDPVLLDQLTPHPLSLKTLTILTVSKAISQAGPPSLRAQRVDSLPIPEKIKKILKFKVR